MATIQPLRGGQVPPPEAAANDSVPGLPPGSLPSAGLVPAGATLQAAALAPWLAGRPTEARLVDLLAFALATERGEPPTPEVMDAERERAHAALATYSIRNLHNRVAEIRQEAVMEYLGRFARPAGFVKIVMANLLALLLFGLLGGALYLHPETLAALVGLLPG